MFFNPLKKICHEEPYIPLSRMKGMPPDEQGSEPAQTAGISLENVSPSQ